MLAERNIDPYTAVAEVLKETPACRRGLRASTDLAPEVIDAALTRFEVMGSVDKFIKGGEEYFRWKAGVESPLQSLPKVARDDTPNLNTKGRPKGWNLSKAVRAIVDEMPDGAQFSMPAIYEDLCRRHSGACETYKAHDLRTQISQHLAFMNGKTAERIGLAADNKTKVYRKGFNGAEKLSARSNGTVSLNGSGKTGNQVQPQESPQIITRNITNPSAPIRKAESVAQLVVELKLARAEILSELAAIDRVIELFEKRSARRN